MKNKKLLIKLEYHRNQFIKKYNSDPFSIVAFKPNITLKELRKSRQERLSFLKELKLSSLIIQYEYAYKIVYNYIKHK